MTQRRSRLLKLAAMTIVAVGLGIWYVKSHPLVFNESLWEHAHCMPQAGCAFRTYAVDNGGRFPYSTNGYGDALLLMTNEMGKFWAPHGPGAIFQSKPVAAFTCRDYATPTTRR